MNGNRTPVRIAKTDHGPVAHVRAFVTRVCGRRSPVYDFDQRLAAMVARAEAEAAAQDVLLSVRAR